MLPSPSRMPLRTFELQGHEPSKWGEQHGEAFRDEIAALYEIRLRFTLQDTDLKTEDAALALARYHLPLLERFDAALFSELNGIARGSGLSCEQLVVVNHYTDLRHLRQRDLANLSTGDDPSGCSSVFVQPGKHRILAQTWDMQASAEPHVILLKLAGADGRSTVLFTVTGCLGMTGATSWGTALAVNSMSSSGPSIGVIWPALVRKSLRLENADAMRALIESSPIGAGRHYTVADDRDFFGIETSGTQKKVIRAGGTEPYFHTNHCIDPEMSKSGIIAPGGTTVARFETLKHQLGRHVPGDARAVFDSLADVSLPPNPQKPEGLATCGAIAFDVGQRLVIACAGLPGPGVAASAIELR